MAAPSTTTTATPNHAAKYTFAVEHLDPELGPWSLREYQTIAEECHTAGNAVCLSNLPVSLQSQFSESVRQLPNVKLSSRRADGLFHSQLSENTVCLLDPGAPQALDPQDAQSFSVFLFGGILGDDPPRDRTSELRVKGYPRRHLGSVQMTTDTAVRVTRLVIQQQKNLNDIPYVDYPDLRFNRNESTEMPFRYIKAPDGGPLMPPGMEELIQKDSEKGFAAEHEQIKVAMTAAYECTARYHHECGFQDLEKACQYVCLFFVISGVAINTEEEHVNAKEERIEKPCKWSKEPEVVKL